MSTTPNNTKQNLTRLKNNKSIVVRRAGIYTIEHLCKRRRYLCKLYRKMSRHSSPVEPDRCLDCGSVQFSVEILCHFDPGCNASVIFCADCGRDDKRKECICEIAYPSIEAAPAAEHPT
jgi:hypothetical protein